jgi:hypothetical protein
LTFEPFTYSGYQLLHEGTEELARVEANGIRVDVPLLKKTKESLIQKKRETKSLLEQDGIWKHWKRRFGESASLTAKDQVRYVVYDVLKTEKASFTKKGTASVDDEVLQKIDHPFIKLLTKFNKYDKALGTFLSGIEWEIVGDRIHPNFHLDTARTFRSSSSEPNFQNFPVRDKDIAKIIRSLFIPSEDCVLPENDFKGIEVGISACYHKDANFIKYISNPAMDMHRDCAAQVYMLEEYLKDWKWPSAKDIRYGAKNKFVFPEFYGAWFKDCAKDLWEWIDKGKLARPDGMSLKKHLALKGIRSLGACDPKIDPVKGTFEWHLKEVEKDFWQNRFREYAQWKKDWNESYLDKGYFDLLSGFRVRGIYDRKQVCNYPIQGAAFHCLLWCLIQINKLIRKYKMKSMVVGQIHDSLLGDTPVDELRDYLEIVEHVVKVMLPKHFRWIEVPLEVEFELSGPDSSWNDKREYKFDRGQFKNPAGEGWTRDTNRFLEAFMSMGKPERPHLEPRTGHRSKFEATKIKTREGMSHV